MRAILATSVSLAICVTLFGCGQSQQQAQAPAAPVAVAATPPCNCQPAKTASAEPTVRRHHHRRHSWSESASYSEGPSYSGSSSYSEHSSSSVREYRPGDEEQDSGDLSAEERTAQTANASADAWIDGYGRRHYRDYGPLDDEHPGLISSKDQRVRARAWHGYDSDSDNRID
jgi:hypothetical protein